MNAPHRGTAQSLSTGFGFPLSALFHQVLVELLEVTGSQLGQLDVSDAGDRVGVDAHISQSKFAKEHGLNLSMFERWMKEYGEQGEAGLASHRDRCGNRYAALHTSKTLDEMGQLQLRMAKLEADVARLNKGYRVKGSGSQKEFVTGSGKSFRSSKI